MPSSLSHAMVAAAAGSVIAPRALLRPFLVVGAACAVLPDVDAIGRPFFGARGDLEILGRHRGFLHSLTFAAMLGVAVACATFAGSRWKGYRVRLALFVSAVTAAHGGLDTLTSIGASTSPVQFFSPFSPRGYTSSWHPINGPFSELFYCLLPLLLLTRFAWYLRGIRWPRRMKEKAVELCIR